MGINIHKRPELITQEKQTENEERKYTRFQIHEGMRKLCTDIRLNPVKYENLRNKEIHTNIDDVVRTNTELLMKFIS